MVNGKTDLLLLILGSLMSNDDDNGSENIAKKNEFASFQILSRLFGTVQFVRCTPNALWVIHPPLLSFFDVESSF